jgi:hypothetical protein
MASPDKPILPRNSLTTEQVLEICRTNVEALHNLHYIMKAHVDVPRLLLFDLDLMNSHLQKMTNELCRKI